MNKLKVNELSLDCSIQSKTHRDSSDSLVGKALAHRFSWLLGSTSGHSIAAFRVLFGTYFLVYLLSFAPRLYVSFSDHGLAVPYIIPDWTLPPVACTLVYSLMIIANLAFIVGFRARIACPLLLFIYIYFYLLNIAVKNTAHERLNLILLGIMCFAKCDTVWALRPSSPPISSPCFEVPIWPLRLITTQIAFLYAGAGIWKLANPLWHDGSLLYFSFMGDWATPLGFWIVRKCQDPIVWKLVSWVIIAWEIAFPIGLMVPRFRLLSVLTGLFFHLGVLLTLGIPEFLNCATAYVLFFPAQEVRDTGNRLFASIGRRFVQFSLD